MAPRVPASPAAPCSAAVLLQTRRVCSQNLLIMAVATLQHCSTCSGSPIVQLVYSPGIVGEVLGHMQVHGDVVPVVRVAAHPLPLHHCGPAPAITGHYTGYTGHWSRSSPALRHGPRLGFLERARASCSSPLQSPHVLVTRTTAASTTIMRAACSPTVHPAPPPAPAPHNPRS